MFLSSPAKDPSTELLGTEMEKCSFGESIRIQRSAVPFSETGRTAGAPADELPPKRPPKRSEFDNDPAFFRFVSWSAAKVDVWRACTCANSASLARRNSQGAVAC